MNGTDDREITKEYFRSEKKLDASMQFGGVRSIGKKRKYNIFDTLVKISLLYGAETVSYTHLNRSNRK